MIEINPINKVYAYIKNLTTTQKDLIYNRFSIDYPGKEFVPNYKNGIWDGCFHFFNKGLSTLPGGLIPELCETLNEIGAEYANNCVYESNSDIKYDTSLNPVNITPTSYQIRAVESALKKKRTIIESATSSGKSLMMSLIAQMILKVNPSGKVCIIVPFVQLVNQLKKEFISYGVSPDLIGVSTLKKGKANPNDPELTKPIVISTWQTLYRLPKSYFHSFNALLLDEAHTFAKSITDIMNFSINCDYMIGFSGSVKKTCKMYEYLYRGFFHNVTPIIEARELIDMGFATEVYIQPIHFIYNHRLYNPDFMETPDSREQGVLCAKHKGRILKIKGMIDYLFNEKYFGDQANKNTLLLYSSVKNGFFKELVKFAQKCGINACFINGKVDAKKRDEYVLNATKTDNNLIIASFKTFATGINLKNLHRIIFSESVGETFIKQAIGRGMRKLEGKDQVIVYDIMDYFKGENVFISKNNYRYKLYKQMRLKVLPYQKTLVDVNFYGEKVV